jgi:hypothetical protein
MGSMVDLGLKYPQLEGTKKVHDALLGGGTDQLILLFSS